MIEMVISVKFSCAFFFPGRLSSGLVLLVIDCDLVGLAVRDSCHKNAYRAHWFPHESPGFAVYVVLPLLLLCKSFFRFHHNYFKLALKVFESTCVRLSVRGPSKTRSKTTTEVASSGAHGGFGFSSIITAYISTTFYHGMIIFISVETLLFCLSHDVFFVRSGKVEEEKIEKIILEKVIFFLTIN